MTRELLQQALNVLRGCLEHPDAADAIAALESAITQPAPAAPYQVTDDDVDLALAECTLLSVVVTTDEMRRALEAHEARKGAQPVPPAATTSYLDLAAIAPKLLQHAKNMASATFGFTNEPGSFEKSVAEHNATYYRLIENEIRSALAQPVQPAEPQQSQAAMPDLCRYLKDAPPMLNTNDKAFWVVGWNECAELVKAAWPQPVQPATEPAAQEPVAYMVFWGIGEKRPHYPAYKTREIALLEASQIKSETEIRPLFDAIAQPEQPAIKQSLTVAEQSAELDAGMAEQHYCRGYGVALSDAEEAIDDECRERVVTASDCIELIRNLGAAPHSAQPVCKKCNGTKVVSDGQITHSESGVRYENGPVVCIKDCPACTAIAQPVQPAAPVCLSCEKHELSLEKMARNRDDWKDFYKQKTAVLPFNEAVLLRDLVMAINDINESHTLEKANRLNNVLLAARTFLKEKKP